jgi:Mce-associated membrane protein
VTPNWYDLLDVDRGASAEEIRTAWKAAIADLEPDDRRFRVYNEAGAVLLDPARRAGYDATLAEDEPEATVVPDEGPGDADDGTPTREAHAEPARGRPWPVAALAVLALALVATTAFAWTRPDPVDEDAARAAARVAVVPVLSYDYRTLEEDAAAARTYLTPGLRKDYDDTFTLIEANAPRTKTVVAVEEPLADGVVRSSEDRVDVLLYVNMPTTNAQGSVTNRNQVTMRMKLVDGDWLVDDLVTDSAER